MDRLFVICGMTYAILGMLLGIVMAATENHGQLVAHAHIMLVGFVVSFIYGLCYKLWLNNEASKLAWAQFGLHQLGAICLAVGLFLLYGNFITAEKIEPVLTAGSNSVLLGMILMVFMFIRSGRVHKA